MQKIKSFEVDHTKLDVGMYISRVDDDIVTYDIRMVKPNTPPFLESAGLHTFEHLFATYVRNSEFSKNIVYAGPMGCRTGFYFLTRKMSHQDAINLVRRAMNFIANFDGEIPGATEKECGNYLEHNLKMARLYAGKMSSILENRSINDLEYKK